MNINKQSNRLVPSVDAGRADVLVDIVLIALVTAFAFGLAYHPYFFGDELVIQSMAIKHDYSIMSMLQDAFTYKPRLVFNGIEIMLGALQAPRWVHASIVAGCMVYINVVLYAVVRSLLGAGRPLAWLVVVVVLTSRFGTCLYFDYIAGMIELLSDALFLSTLVLAWLAWRGEIKWAYAVGALGAAILCIFVHESLVGGLFVTGLMFAVAEWAGPATKRRTAIVVWALSLGFIPLLLFWVANSALGSLPMATGTAGKVVTVGWDTVWCALTYSYNVFLGGNYGHAWFWGSYNHLHQAGKIIGWVTVACTAALIALAVFCKTFSPNNWRLGVALIAISVGIIAVASLTGSDRQEARFMFPVGILVAIVWIIMLKDAWRHVAIAMLLMTNLIYLLLGSYDSMAVVYASRAASSVAGSLLGVMPNGRNGLVVGNRDDVWTIGGNANGDTFSKVNLKSTVHIDPFVAGPAFDPALYDFGLVFNGFGPHRTARYRLVSIDTALILAGVSDVDKLPVKTVLGSGETWKQWRWNGQPEVVDGAVKLGAGKVGWYPVPVSSLDRRWLTYRARTVSGAKVPLRLQVNWHANKDNRFLGATIEVVYPTEAWHSYAILLTAPTGADFGAVYATLHDGVQGEVELKLVELR